MQGPLSHLLALGPHLLVYVAGALLAIAWWRRHPWASGLTLAGLGLKLLASLLQVALNHHVQRLVSENADSTRIQRHITAIGFLEGLMHAAGLALIVAAVFVDRRRGP